MPNCVQGGTRSRPNGAAETPSPKGEYLAGLVVTFIYSPYRRSSTKYLIRWLFLKLHLPLLYSHRFVPLAARNEQSLPRWLVCFVAPTYSSVLLPNLSIACIVKRNGRLPASAFGIPLSYRQRIASHYLVGFSDFCAFPSLVLIDSYLRLKRL